MNIRHTASLVQQTFQEWREEDITRMGAALAYFAAFSVLPLVLLVTAGLGMVFGAQAVELEIVRNLRDFVSPQVAQTAQDMLNTFYANQQVSYVTLAISAGALISAATGFFRHLKSALNVIWNVNPAAPNKVKGFLRDTLISIVTVIGVGLGLLVLFAANAGLFTLLRSLDQVMPDSQRIALWQLLGLGLLFLGTLLLFGIIFKFLPDAHVKWRDVWVGAAVTAVLFTIGQVILGAFLSNSSMDSLYGAASAFMLVLIWVYFSAHLILIGAEFTQVYSNQYGSKITPQPKED